VQTENRHPMPERRVDIESWWESAAFGLPKSL
jgi:hypothetical protein